MFMPMRRGKVGVDAFGSTAKAAEAGSNAASSKLWSFSLCDRILFIFVLVLILRMDQETQQAERGKRGYVEPGEAATEPLTEAVKLVVTEPGGGTIEPLSSRALLHDVVCVL